MEQHKGKIGLKEYIAIVILAIGTKLADDTPAIIYEQLSNAAWMAPIISGLLVIFPIFFLLKVLSYYPNKNLLEVLEILLGKPLSRLIVLAVMITGSILNTIDTSIYTDIIGTMYFTETPTFIIYFILMAVSAYGAKKGIEQIGSVAWAVITYIKFSLFAALILSLSMGNLNYLFPFFGPGKWEVVKESSQSVSLYMDFFFLGVLASYISSTKVLKKATWISLIILIIEFPLALIAYASLYDYESAKLLNYPFHESIRYISVGFLTNIETFFFPFWLVATFVRFSIYLYISAVVFGWFFKIKSFEYLIPTIASLIVIFGMFPESPTFSMAQTKQLILNFSSPAFLVLPVLLWIRVKMKGGFTNESDNM